MDFDLYTVEALYSNAGGALMLLVGLQ